MSNIWNQKNVYLLGGSTRISCDIHPEWKKFNCYKGHFDTDSVWCPISEITKIFIFLEIWHRFRVMCTRNQKNWNCYWGHFDTDFVWCPISEITEKFMSLEIWHKFRVMSTRNQKSKIMILGHFDTGITFWFFGFGWTSHEICVKSPRT